MMLTFTNDCEKYPIKVLVVQQSGANPQLALRSYFTVWEENKNRTNDDKNIQELQLKSITSPPVPENIQSHKFIKEYKDISNHFAEPF